LKETFNTPKHPFGLAEVSTKKQIQRGHAGMIQANELIHIYYQSRICSGKLSGGSPSFVGGPCMTKDRSHCARVTKTARTLPSGGR